MPFARQQSPIEKLSRSIGERVKKASAVPFLARKRMLVYCHLGGQSDTELGLLSFESYFSMVSETNPMTVAESHLAVTGS